MDHVLPAVTESYLLLRIYQGRGTIQLREAAAVLAFLVPTRRTAGT
jgi:hypothetical protein